MRHGQHAHYRMLAFSQEHEHNRAGAILHSFLAAFARFAFPQIRIADDEPRPGLWKAHGFQSLSSESRWAYSSGISVFAIKAISSSEKSSNRTTRRSRRLRRAYSSADRITRRSRPFLVIVTGSVSALSAKVP